MVSSPTRYDLAFLQLWKGCSWRIFLNQSLSSPQLTKQDLNESIFWSTSRLLYYLYCGGHALIEWILHVLSKLAASYPRIAASHRPFQQSILSGISTPLQNPHCLIDYQFYRSIVLIFLILSSSFRILSGLLKLHWSFLLSSFFLYQIMFLTFLF